MALELLIPFYKNISMSKYEYGGNHTYYIWELAFSEYNIGRIYEDSGNEPEAIKHYQQFLENFKNSDPGIPEKKDAEERIKRISGNLPSFH